MKFVIALIIVFSYISLEFMFGEIGISIQHAIGSFAVGWLSYDISRLIVGEY